MSHWEPKKLKKKKRVGKKQCVVKRSAERGRVYILPGEVRCSVTQSFINKCRSRLNFKVNKLIFQEQIFIKTRRLWRLSDMSLQLSSAPYYLCGLECLTLPL